MDKAGVYPPPCEFQAIGAAAVKACDTLDGVEDGVISMPPRCLFDPHTLVGQSFDCDGTEKTITAAAAEAIEAAWTGPRGSAGEFQWYGFGKDSVMWGPMGPLATKCGDDGRCDGIRFPISDVWIRYFVAKDSNLDVRAISPQQWDDLFKASVNEYESIIGTSDPDLSRFRNNGGKLITWHGMADQLIPVNGSVEYADRVLAHDPNAHDFYRLFLAPGADHSMRKGITPKDPLKALVEWVENGVAPKVLRAAGPNGFGVQVERDICVYPQVQHYVAGDPAVSSSFTCT
jgi:feruloyl esterase